MLRPILKLATIPLIGFAAFAVAQVIGGHYSFDSGWHQWLLLGGLVILLLSNLTQNITLSASGGFAVAVVAAMIILEVYPHIGTVAEYLAGQNPALSSALFATTAFVGGVVITLMRASDIIDRCFGIVLIDDRQA